MPSVHSRVQDAATGRDNGAPPALCVLVVDAHQLVSTALRTALHVAGLDAHDIPVDGHDPIVAAAAHYPDAVVLLEPALGVDTEGRRIGAVALIAALTRQGKRVLVLSEHVDHSGAAIAAGAIGAITKSVPLESLLRTLAVAAAGLPVMTRAEHAHWLACHHRHEQRAQDRGRRLGRLTPREGEVLALMASGHRAAAIAELFVVAPATVRTQIHSVLNKLEVGSQLAAVALLFDTSPIPARVPRFPPEPGQQPRGDGPSPALTRTPQF